MKENIKFYGIAWLLVHAFLAGFCTIIYLAVPVDAQQRLLSELPASATIVIALEFIVIGFVVSFYKLFTAE